MRNRSNENEFDLHESGLPGEIHFHMNGFTRRPILTQRQKLTWKWPIEFFYDKSIPSVSLFPLFVFCKLICLFTGMLKS